MANSGRTLAELRARLKALKANMQNAFEDIATEMANSGKSLAERAIISRGLPGEKYSTADVPAFWLMDKALNAKGRKFLKSQAQDGTNWGELRAAQGLPNDKVDLYYSGEMWKNIAVVRIERKDGKVLAILGGKIEASQNKLDWNRDRYGEFILENIRAADRKFIKKVAEDKIAQIIKNSL
jgi:hypothetical protein